MPANPDLTFDQKLQLVQTMARELGIQVIPRSRPAVYAQNHLSHSIRSAHSALGFVSALDLDTQPVHEAIDKLTEVIGKVSEMDNSVGGDLEFEERDEPSPT